MAVVASAKVIELIGLALWMASQAHPKAAKDFRPVTYYWYDFNLLIKLQNETVLVISWFYE